MRDEFGEDVKRAVAARVGNLCSNPDCRALTSGPQNNPTKSLNVGVAAHITAAAPGGPRYNPVLPPEQRRHTDNAIWLCQNCAKLIDNDPALFPESKLHRWKKGAENAALSRVGKSATSNGSAHTELPGELSQLAKSATIIRIRPVIPAKHERDNFQVREATGNLVSVEKCSTSQSFDIPTKRVFDLLPALSGEPATILLDGRLQWVTTTQRWKYFEGKPDPGLPFGFSKPSSLNDPYANEIINRCQDRGFEFGWAHYVKLTTRSAEGWEIVYDDDGRYFCISDTPYDLVLIAKPSK